MRSAALLTRGPPAAQQTAVCCGDGCRRSKNAVGATPGSGVDVTRLLGKDTLELQTPHEKGLGFPEQLSLGHDRIECSFPPTFRPHRGA